MDMPRMTSPLCGSVHGDCLPAVWYPRRAGQFRSWAGSFLLKVLPTYAPPLGTSPPTKALTEWVSPGGHAGLTWLCLLDPRVAGSSIGRWTGPIRLSRFGHGDSSQRGVGTGRTNGTEWVLGWIFSCIYSNEKTEDARGQGKQENWVDMQRETRGKSIWREDARESKSEPAVSSPFPYGRCVRFLWSGPVFSPSLPMLSSKSE